MRTYLLLLTCLLTLASCNFKNNKADEISSTENIEVVSNEQTTTIVADTIDSDTTKAPESLNDIRFDGWDRAKWADNEYIRTVRRYLDAYNNGETKNANLDEYKDYIKGKFVIGDIQPCIMGGGAFMYIIFYNNPEKVFTTMVNSSIDEETKEVYDYCCMGLKLEDFESGYTQEDIKQFLKDYPHHKMW